MLGFSDAAGGANASDCFDQEYGIRPSASACEDQLGEEADGNLLGSRADAVGRSEYCDRLNLTIQAKNSLSVRVAEANAERAARSKLEEELEATKRSVVKLNERQETMATTSLSVGEVKLQEERDKLLVSICVDCYCGIVLSCRKSCGALAVSKTSSNRSSPSVCTVSCLDHVEHY